MARMAERYVPSTDNRILNFESPAERVAFELEHSVERTKLAAAVVASCIKHVGIDAVARMVDVDGHVRQKKEVIDLLVQQLEGVTLERRQLYDRAAALEEKVDDMRARVHVAEIEAQLAAEDALALVGPERVELVPCACGKVFMTTRALEVHRGLHACVG